MADASESVVHPSMEREFDTAITDVPKPTIAELQTAQLPWLNSWEFCTQYEHPPAQRVHVRRNARNEIESAVFYRERLMFGAISVLEIAGYPGVSAEDLEGLMHARGAAAATV